MKKTVSTEDFNKMVDLVLKSNGTPRHQLFEYPHRDDDSRQMINKAETVVWEILTLAKVD